MPELKGGYVEVLLQNPEAEEIIATLLQGGITLPEYNLHCTLMYDKGDPEKPLAVLNPLKVFTAHVLQIDVLGTGLVFHLTSPALVEEHLRLKAAGYDHSFDSFLPHMSLTYDFNNYDILLIKQLFRDWGGRELRFSNEQFGAG